jgi:flagellar M-ring protein FliF
VPTFVQSLLRLPTRTKAIVAVSAVAILAIAFLMLQVASSPSYATLAAGLAPADTGKYTSALDEAGITYELQSNGTALAVEKAQVSKARIALAGQGLAASGGPGSQEGFELFDKQKLGASDFQNKVTYQRALEGEIARTINGVQGVSGASVQLVLPEDDLFADSSTPATAAVMLSNPADAMEPGAVRGIAQLVASSVKGLKTENVTITDSSGSLLWPNGDSAGAAPGASNKQAAEARYARSLEASLTAMLARTLGPGKAQVQVNADLNVDKTTKNELVYGKKGTPLKTTEETEKLRGKGATSGGTAGTGSNVPTYSAGAGGGSGNNSYDRKSGTTDYGVDKTVSKTEVAPGQVNKMQVALLVDKSVPAAAFTGIQNAVKSAAGVDATRGDVFQAVQVPFAKAETPKAGPVPTSLLGPLKWVGLGLAALLFCFFMARGIRRRESETLAEPAWLREIEAPVRLAELEAGAPTALLPARQPDASMHKLDQLMDREPERVAAQVRQWLSED